MINKPLMKTHTNTSHHHGLRIVFMGVLILAIGLTKLDAVHLPELTRHTGQVLAYATAMNTGDLYAAANSSRSASGLAQLALNDQFNNSATAKAQHMINNVYWAHVAPDGTQPW